MKANQDFQGEKKVGYKREDSGFQLTGWPITRPRQLNLDQLIPAVHVHLCLQLQRCSEIPHEHERKLFWWLNPENAPRFTWAGGRRRARVWWSIERRAANSTSVQPVTPPPFRPESFREEGELGDWWRVGLGWDGLHRVCVRVCTYIHKRSRTGFCLGGLTPRGCGAAPPFSFSESLNLVSPAD